MTKQQRVLQALGELALPILGLYYLDWSIYFILLYYLLDSFANEIFYHVKIKKIITFNGNQQSDRKTWWVSSIIQTLFFLLLIFIVHVSMFNVYPGIELKKEFWNFLMYEEDLLPFPQVYILLPLVVLTKYIQYKNEFLIRQKFRNTTTQIVTKNSKRVWFFTLSLASFLYGLSFLVQLPETVWLFAIIIPKLFHDLYLSPN